MDDVVVDNVNSVIPFCAPLPCLHPCLIITCTGNATKRIIILAVAVHSLSADILMPNSLSQQGPGCTRG